MTRPIGGPATAPEAAPGEGALGARTLTFRAVVTGMLLGAVLTPCNIYSGLKIGWSFNVSVLAVLIAAAFWALAERLRLGRAYAAGEGNITQTTASSSANIISGGLVAPIPALAMLTGGNLPAQELVAWVFAVSFLGIWVAWYLRDSLILRSGLPFPIGRATAETLREVFERGRAAALKLRVLLGATALSAALKWADGTWLPLPRPDFGFTLTASGALSGYGGVSARNLTFTLDPSLMLLGFGAIIGFRAGVSLLLGGILSWGLLGPWGLAEGFIIPGADDPAASWFAPMIEWLLWPGVALMVASALTRLALRTTELRRSGRGSPVRTDDGGRTARVAGLGVAAALAVTAQTVIFGIHWAIAALAVPIAFLLAVVASRVVGETGIPPIGAIGKISQLSTGVTAPGELTANLTGANVAGGAAGQSADLLNDFKAGHLVGTPPQPQVVAQFFGILTGSLVGSLVYLKLIPDPASMLITEEWPAPAVATWKVVAETLSQGIATVPPSALWAIAVAGAVGIAAAWIEQRRGDRWLPSMTAVGLAMVIPASLAITMFLGSLIAKAVEHWHPTLAQRFLIAAASGLIAGESLTGVAQALLGILSS